MATSRVAAIAARVALVPVVKITLTLRARSSPAAGCKAARLPLTLRVSIKRFFRAAFQQHLDGAGLDQVERVALIALRKDRRSGLKRSLLHFSENLGDVFARKAGKNRNTADRISEAGFHGGSDYRMTLSAFFSIV